MHILYSIYYSIYASEYISVTIGYLGTFSQNP